MNVWALAESRAELPQFSGATIVEQLYNAQREAAARLSKYVGSLQYDAEQAEAVLHQVTSWVERERPDLEAQLANPGSAHLPAELQLELGVEKVRQFVVASYSVATRTLGPWLSGAVYDKIIAGEISQPDMEADAHARLSIYASIVKWDDDGDLVTLFAPSAMGNPWVIAGVVVIALVAVAAVLMTSINSTMITRMNAELFDKMCRDAQAKGDTNTVQRCLELSASIQKEEIGKGDTVGTVAKWAAVVALGYLAGRYIVLPMLSKKGMV